MVDAVVLGADTTLAGVGVTLSSSVGVFDWVDATGADQLMYIGDRWQSSPDGLKSHDLQAWIPLSFAEDGTLLPMVWVDEFEVWL